MAKKGTAVTAAKANLPADWEQQMKDMALRGRKAVQNLGTDRARIKTRGGILTFNDNPMPGNKLPAVVLAHALENAFYIDDYDPDNPRSPVCFAFGNPLNPDEPLVPHRDAPQPQAKDCRSCPKNAWGSAEKGRGKACKNTVQLMVMHADSLKAKNLDEAIIATASVSPTSGKAWRAYVDQLATVAGKPPFAFVTEIAIVPDPKNQFKWMFSTLKEVDKKVMPMVFQKAQQAEQELAARPPYQPNEEAPAKPAKSKPVRRKF